MTRVRVFEHDYERPIDDDRPTRSDIDGGAPMAVLTPAQREAGLRRWQAEIVAELEARRESG